MLENFLTVAGQVATLFMLMGVGFALRKRGFLTDATVKQLSYILLHVVAPCIIVESFFEQRDLSKLQGMGVAALASAGYFVFALLISAPLFRRRGARRHDGATAPSADGDVLRFAAIYPNAGFMGFPLVAGVLGDSAMAYASVFVVVFTLMQWTHGVAVMGGSGSASLKRAVINPGTVSLAFGLLIFLAGLELPWPATSAVSMAADLNTPLAMLVIGAQMARSGIAETFRAPALYAVAGLKLIVFPTVTALALALPFWRLDPMIYATAVILSAAPTAGVTAIFADRFGKNPSLAAQSVTLVTLLSIATIPFFAAAVMP